jgi:hypothetical protein
MIGLMIEPQSSLYLERDMYICPSLVPMCKYAALVLRTLDW